VPGAQARLEFALDREGRLRVRSSHGLEVGGETLGKEGTVLMGQEVRSGGVTVFVDARTD
jgi:hypothetical protein